MLGFMVGMLGTLSAVPHPVIDYYILVEDGGILLQEDGYALIQ
jgi:hypothetical protein